jgi:hypothetical protein
MQETSGLIPPINLGSLSWEFADAKPYPHHVIDGFFTDDFARELAAEFPAFDAPAWHRYSNPLEVKRTCNDWNAFGPATYRALTWLNSPSFVELLRLTLRMDEPLYADAGLHGGGLHAHSAGGRLNTHLDYSRHPKTGLARRLNLLVYLNPDWQDEWGGHLGLWEQNPVQPGPGVLAKSIAPKFNRAVIFATPGAWHGLPQPIQCPEGQVRKSLAVYYLSEASRETDTRTRALFAPGPEQIGDADILQLIERRSDERTVGSVYRVGG